ncbi:MAG: TerC family protein [Burkholderiaceae bacterium]|nr:TerC family protein [Burkholderiaceae bacterium]
MIDFFQALHWGAIFQIILIDILLGGDNAVVIALACRNLEEKQRTKGIIWGTAGAIILRVVLIAFALTLLAIPFLKLAGGLLLLWIGIKLLAPADDGHGNVSGSSTLWSAVKTIIIADFVMSLDNVIAIAAAATNAHLDHQLYYVIFGLVVSVPIIVWGSTLVLKLIDRFPMVVTFGAALLGWIAGGMMVSDIFVVQQLTDIAGGRYVTTETIAAAADGAARTATVIAPTVLLVAEIIGAILVVALGKWIYSRKSTVKEGTHGSV